MTTTETRLREALHERAQDVPETALERLAAHDYRPRTRRLRPSLAIGAGAAASAGAIAAIVSLTAGASSAFAGWTPTPNTPTSGQVASAKLNCSARSPISGLPLVLTDTRGPFTFQIYADDHASAVCTTGPSFQSVQASASTRPVKIPADKLEANGVQTASKDGQPYSFLDGMVGSQVSGVTVVLSDGTRVTATVQNGWFVAWWPGSTEATKALIAIPSGTITTTISQAGPGLPPPATATGNGPSTSSSQQSGSISGGGQALNSLRTGGRSVRLPEARHRALAEGGSAP